jgi:hypothetical protein
MRSLYAVCALLLAATCNARPMVINQAQVIDAPAGYYYFGYQYAIDGDWAIIAAATPSPTQASPQQTHDALLYHRINGVWTFDRVLIRRVSTQYSDPSVQFHSMAMNNGVVAIGSNPTRIFRRTNGTWTEIAHPFSAPQGDPDAVGGELLWDGNRLLAAQSCGSSLVRPWGALLSNLNADNSWTPVERISSGDTSCNWDPVHWGISGNTVVTGTYSFDYEVGPDQVKIFRRSGSAWNLTSTIDGGDGDGDVRGDEMFIQAYSAGASRVYRNDDTKTVIDKLRTVGESYAYGGPGFGLAHTNDVVVRGKDLFRKNAAGKYEHAAVLVPTGSYGLGNLVKISGNRAISQAFGRFTTSNQSVMFFDLPATYTPSPVISTGFGDGTSPFTAQTGAFAVANVNGNHVYRQSSLSGDYRALLGNSDWAEQSIEAEITPTEFSGADRWVGLAVRYQDEANYYYVTLRSSGIASIKSMRNGVYSTLAQGQVPIVLGRKYRVSLQAVNNMVALRIDGKPVMSGGEEPLQMIPHGRAALLGYKASADYDNVVVAQVGQIPIYELAIGSCWSFVEDLGLWTRNGAGTWNCSSSTGQNVLQQTSTAGIARALVGTPTDDQMVQTRARFSTVNGTDRWFGVTARYVDENNYYYLTLRSSNKVSLRKLVNGVITDLGTATLSVTPNTWYTLRLDTVGNEVRALVNGTQLFQVTDSSHASGQGGVLTYKAAAEYADYRSWQP